MVPGGSDSADGRDNDDGLDGDEVGGDELFNRCINNALEAQEVKPALLAYSVILRNNVRRHCV